MHSLFILFSIFPQMAFEATSRQLELFVNEPISLDCLFKAIMLSFAEYSTVEEPNSSCVLLWNSLMLLVDRKTLIHSFMQYTHIHTQTHRRVHIHCKYLTKGLCFCLWHIYAWRNNHIFVGFSPLATEYKWEILCMEFR